MWKLLLLVTIVTKVSVQSYIISDGCSSSVNASSMCELATPLISFSKDGQQVNLTNSNINTINESMWVGFVMVYSTFVYKGCASGNGPLFQNLTVAIRADPGHCYSYCRTPYIGIKKRQTSGTTTCICLETVPKELQSTECKEACTVPISTLCGNWNQNNNGIGAGNTFVSVYEKVDEPVAEPSTFSSSDKDGRCLALEPIARHFVWSNCSTFYRRICQDGSSNVIQKNDTYTNWGNIMLECIQDNYFPMDLRTNLSDVQQTGSQLWIGAIRSYSIFSISDAKTSKGTYLQGYIDTNWKLHFDSQNSTLRSLCIDYSTSSSSSSTDSITSTPSTTNCVRHSTPTRSNSAPRERDTTTSLTSTPTRGESKAVQSDGSKGGIVAVYVLIPLIAIAIAVTIVCVICRRRKKLPEKHPQPHEISCNTNNYDTNASTGTTLSLDDSISKQADATVRHDYFILDPVNEYAAINDTEMDHADDEDYDTTEGTTRVNVTGNDTGNIYNRLDGVSEDTYNHTNTLNIRDDDTYNHTGNCGDETTYNTTEPVSRSKNGDGVANCESRHANDVDDTYNHTDGAGSKLELKHDTEDTYNKPDCDMRDAKQVANAYSFTKPFRKTPVVSPDKGKTKYDYAFTEPGATVGSTKPIRFKLDQPAAAGNYAFATQPSASEDYQLAKPPGD